MNGIKSAPLILMLLALVFGLVPTAGAGEEDLSQVRIKKFPVAMQCWTYRKLSL